MKKTNICPICANGQLIEKRIRVKYTKQIIDQEHIAQLEEQCEAYKKHSNLAEYQREEHNSQRQSLGVNACIIIMDFKKNLNIGGGIEETPRDFYTKSEITDLGFCIYIKQSEKLIKKHTSFVSENLSHNTYFVKSPIRN